jgi:hypothetical protein
VSQTADQGQTAALGQTADWGQTADQGQTANLGQADDAPHHRRQLALAADPTRLRGMETRATVASRDAGESKRLPPVSSATRPETPD